MTLNDTMQHYTTVYKTMTLYNVIQDYTAIYKAIRHCTTCTLYNVIQDHTMQDYTTLYYTIDDYL